MCYFYIALAAISDKKKNPLDFIKLRNHIVLEDIVQIGYTSDLWVVILELCLLNCWTVGMVSLIRFTVQLQNRIGYSSLLFTQYTLLEDYKRIF